MGNLNIFGRDWCSCRSSDEWWDRACVRIFLGVSSFPGWKSGLHRLEDLEKLDSSSRCLTALLEKQLETSWEPPHAAQMNCTAHRQSVRSIPGTLVLQLSMARCKRTCFRVERQRRDVATAATGWWGELEMALLVLARAVAKGEGQQAMGWEWGISVQGSNGGGIPWQDGSGATLSEKLNA